MIRITFSNGSFSTDVSASGSTFALGGSPSLAHLITGVAASLPHPTNATRTLWDARNDLGPYTGPGPLALKGETAEITHGIDYINAMKLKAQMDEDPISTGVFPLGSGSDFTVFLQRIGASFFASNVRSLASHCCYTYRLPPPTVPSLTRPTTPFTIIIPSTTLICGKRSMGIPDFSNIPLGLSTLVL